MATKKRRARLQKPDAHDVQKPTKILAEEEEAGVLDDVPGAEFIDLTYAKRSSKSYQYIKSTWPNEREAFLQAVVAENEQVLRDAGFEDGDIDRMKDGLVPLNHHVHHIIPKDDGGDHSWSNLVIIEDDPYHDALHRLVPGQVSKLRRGEARMIRMPVVEPGIYPPVEGFKMPVPGVGGPSADHDAGDPEPEDPDATADSGPTLTMPKLRMGRP